MAPGIIVAHNVPLNCSSFVCCGGFRRIFACSRRILARWRDGAPEESLIGGALAKAVPSIEKGMGGFLQTRAAQVVKQLSINMDRLPMLQQAEKLEDHE